MLFLGNSKQVMWHVRISVRPSIQGAVMNHPVTPDTVTNGMWQDSGVGKPIEKSKVPSLYSKRMHSTLAVFGELS